MKNILILSSEDDTIFESIVKYFQSNKEVSIKLLCNSFESSLFKKAKKLNIKSLYIENSGLEDFFEENKFDLVVVLNFNKILSEKILKTNVFVNVHPSLLPKYKGLRAIDRAFVNNDSKTGISFHYVSRFLNEGKIIYQRELEINPKWNIKKLGNEIKELIKFYYPRVIEKLLGVNVLVVAYGAKKHLLAEKISQSKMLNELYLVDWDDVSYDIGQKISYRNYADLAKKIKEKNIQLVIVDDENCLDLGVVDFLSKRNIRVFGADKLFSRFESSKYYAKKIMQKYSIKTASCKKITNIADIDNNIKLFKTPIIKADGLAQGCGVYENEDIEKVKHELFKYLSGKHGDASKAVLIEQKLNGFKITLHSFWDGFNLLHLPLCQSFKKNVNGLFTPGLASICPIEIGYENEKRLEIYKKRLLEMLQGEKISTSCVVCSELMVCEDDIYVIEYNVRFSDPDIQVIFNYIQNDCLEIF